MKYFVLVLFLAVITGCGDNGSTETSYIHILPTTPPLSGTITDKDSAQPLEKVKISLYQNKQEIASTTSQNDGTYSFPNLSAGEYTLETEIQGRPSYEYIVQIGDNTIFDISYTDFWTDSVKMSEINTTDVSFSNYKYKSPGILNTGTNYLTHGNVTNTDL